VTNREARHRVAVAGLPALALKIAGISRNLLTFAALRREVPVVAGADGRRLVPCESPSVDVAKVSLNCPLLRTFSSTQLGLPSARCRQATIRELGRLARFAYVRSRGNDP
jgi:hypothetical protein